jgi:hypothetical protein
MCGPAFESLPTRKPRGGKARFAGADHGDLAIADRSRGWERGTVRRDLVDGTGE